MYFNSEMYDSEPAMDEEFETSKRFPKRQVYWDKYSFPKSYQKGGTIMKSVVYGNENLDSIDQLDMDDGGMRVKKNGLSDQQVANQHVSYSLNKKSRWNWVEKFGKREEHPGKMFDGVRVSAMEYQDFVGSRNIGISRRSENVTAYHDTNLVDDSEIEEIYREPNRKMFSNIAAMKLKVGKDNSGKKKEKRRMVAQFGRDTTNILLRDMDETESHEDQTRVEWAHIEYDIGTPLQSKRLHVAHQKQFVRSVSPSSRAYKRNKTVAMEDWERYPDTLDTPSDDVYDEMIDQCIEDSLATEVGGSSRTTAFDLSDCLVQKRMRQRNQSKRSEDTNSFSIIDDIESNSSDWSLTDLPDKDRLLVYIENEDEEEAVAGPSEAVLSPTSPKPVKYFRMYQTEFRTEDEELESVSLTERYGNNYRECATTPRKLYIDITDRINLVHTAIHHSDVLEYHRVQVIVIVQVMPRNSEFLSALWTRGSPLIRVSINGSFNSDKINVITLSLHSIEQGGLHSLEEIICEVVETIGTMPLECFQTKAPKQSGKKQTNTHSVGPFYDSTPSDVLQSVLEIIEEEHKATEVVIENEQHARSLQRQLTAVECYSEWFNDRTNVCLTCYEDLGSGCESTGLALADCQHWFCDLCWRTYLTTQITTGLVPLKCPEYECDTIIDIDVLKSIVPLPLCNLYCAQLRDIHMQRNSKEWIWCPNTTCRRIIRAKTNKGLTSVLTCACGHEWCQKCGKNAHWPADCKAAKMYQDRLIASGDIQVPFYMRKPYENYIDNVRVKSCPHCYVLMEKNQGCPYMACRCGNAFCWNCTLKMDEKHTPESCKAASQKESGSWKVRRIYSLQVTLIELCVRSHRVARPFLFPDILSPNPKHRNYSEHFEHLNVYIGDTLPQSQQECLKNKVKVKRCPNCDMPMEKDFGCIHMTCRCGTAFCWSCLVEWGEGKIHWLCPIETEFGFERVDLVDIYDRKDPMPAIWYRRCVEHYHALNNHGEVLKMRKLVEECFGSHKSLRTISPEIAEQFLLNSEDVNMESVVKCQMLLTKRYVTRFLNLYKQVHNILQYTYVWICHQNKRQTKKSRYVLDQVTERLNFAQTRLEDACRVKNAKKAAHYLEINFDLLKNLINTLKRIKNDM